MKLMHEQLDLITGSPIKVKWCDYKHFTYPLHYHSEFEIVYILKSTGSRFVGDSIEDFFDEDLVLLGSFLPHMYRSDNDYYSPKSNNRVNAVVIQFSNSFFLSAIQFYPELFNIKELLKKSAFGINFHNSVENSEIRKKIISLLNTVGFQRLILLLEILDLMGKSMKYKLLSNQNYETIIEWDDDPRLNKVLTYLNKVYVDPELTLESTAHIASMNPSSFSRYFKQKTSKNFNNYVNELRVGQACKLILQRKLSISQLCYESGFNNISNFNRNFKKITKFTPKEYLKAFSFRQNHKGKS